ncbi:eukaryotic translation initiation factor 6 [Perkinsela sp. CCAP 1560/4]|nr:eukaryotic translation initiation factor 6 [Perkinsela sp. CCAP 1560/4]KNH09162.1 eukaryotic translation initiation factor 6 [Perkinsela sp. CCAP 1560/4]|eukprot:KNH04376.1 eukaryotic translation initiation factor 6 [Perkinsela sp. CCAP 1560/4]
MALRIRFEASDDIGVFSRLTNAYCLVAMNASQNFYSCFEQELSRHIPVVYSSVGGTRLVGRMMVGNKHGLLVPGITTDAEIQHLRNSLPDSVQIQRVDERYNALGNCITCNDHVALIHIDLDSETENIIRDVLRVETFRTSIADNALVGSYSCVTNNGCLVHPRTPVADMEELSSLLQVPVVAGTVNRGGSQVGCGVVVNDWIGFTGLNTTSNEMNIIERIFKLRTHDRVSLVSALKAQE